MNRDTPTNALSFVPTLLWVGLVVAAGAVGYRAGDAHARRNAAPPAARIAAAPVHARIATAESKSEPALAAPAPEPAALTDTWQALHTQPDTADRDRQLAERIERLARTDPERALALAAAENNWRLRDLLRAACVKGWASVAPELATRWVLALKPSERRGAIATALFDGAAQQPEKTTAVAARVIEADPEAASAYGHLAIDALGRLGSFQTAAELATQFAATDASLVTTAYHQWGERDPEAALAAVRTLADATTRRSALEGVVNGWASVDPEQLAQRATQFPREDRSVALSAALSRWAERDPIAATSWIEANDPGEDADEGIVAVTLQSTLAESSPDTALRWAKLIIDPVKRAAAEQSILARAGGRH